MLDPRFWQWAGWRDRGAKPADRPPGLPRRIPRAWWPRYLAHKGVVRPVVVATRPKAPDAYLMFCAQDPLAALRAPLKYAAVLSADLAFRDAVVAAVPALRFQGRRLLSWSDCRPAPGGTPASEAAGMANSLALDGWVGQGESAAEFDHAFREGAQIVVGNLSGLDPFQKGMIRRGTVAWLQEVYWNEDADLRPNFEGLDVRVCVGLYPGAAGYVPLQKYKDAGLFPPGSSVYYAEGVADGDWSGL